MLALCARALVLVSLAKQMVTLALLGDGIRARQVMSILVRVSQASDDMAMLTSFLETSQSEHALR
jgi:hypothetical protein